VSLTVAWYFVWARIHLTFNNCAIETLIWPEICAVCLLERVTDCAGAWCDGSSPPPQLDSVVLHALCDEPCKLDSLLQWPPRSWWRTSTAFIYQSQNLIWLWGPTLCQHTGRHRYQESLKYGKLQSRWILSLIFESGNSGCKHAYRVQDLNCEVLVH
jgi:hypothetical protein